MGLSNSLNINLTPPAPVSSPGTRGKEDLEGRALPNQEKGDVIIIV